MHRWTLALAFVLVGASAVHGHAASTFGGRLLLPSDGGTRGLEVVLVVEDTTGDRSTVWLPVHADGSFSRALDGRVLRATVTVGLEWTLHDVAAEELAADPASGSVDVGVVDLRDDLIARRMTFRAGETSGHEVRATLCAGLPPVGPQGGTVGLGSRQFPPIAVGEEITWILPPDAVDVHVLVEHPNPDGVWFGGRQEIFGPYRAEDLPHALVLE